MSDDGNKHVLRRHAEVFGELGALFAQMKFPRIEVRIPRPIAEFAVHAWERDFESAGESQESFEERVHRRRAGNLALIGLAITERGHWDKEGVAVTLEPVLIGAAVEAVEELPRPD